ncbi:hypothetical protein CORC01_08473 [Colletotrichum orchidophilum]|uniref:Uncharacterized protein n=1 Tax=Colletotrichum orchidophilum TaxID=1209926 RepID=A0A1G4B4M8_9PEZI|nr:uncharacterized protein CORC01_08473 [Colletotrichum orchidophilum]OHE96255.1 hypothetical protein CORC01_08473 [Colletotrichum orchidophilum]
MLPSSARASPFPNVDGTDLEEVLGSKDIISPIHVAQAEQVVDTPKFGDWAIAATSAELLLEGNFGFDESHYISALSVLSATFTQTLRIRDDSISLLFSCGLHPEEEKKEEDDDKGSSTIAGVSMIKSLIGQLLEQHRSFNLTGLDRRIKQRLIKDGDLEELCAPFGWLFERLPNRLTLVCFVDGAVHYEIEPWEDELIKVVGCLLDLVRNEDMTFPVKILVTSPTPTESLQKLFDTEDKVSLLNACHIPGVL